MWNQFQAFLFLERSRATQQATAQSCLGRPYAYLLGKRMHECRDQFVFGCLSNKCWKHWYFDHFFEWNSISNWWTQRPFRTCETNAIREAFPRPSLQGICQTMQFRDVVALVCHSKASNRKRHFGEGNPKFQRSNWYLSHLRSLYLFHWSGAKWYQPLLAPGRSTSSSVQRCLSRWLSAKTSRTLSYRGCFEVAG